MDFTMDLDYELYLESVMEEQIELEHCVNEALALGSGDIDNYREVFVESVGDKLKSGWQKFIGWIKKVWAKFAESLNNIFSGTKDYLDRYKDIILKKKVKEGFNVDIPDHKTGLDRIVYTTIDVIQPDALTAIINSEKDAIKSGKESNGEEINNNPQVKTVLEVYNKAKIDINKTDQSEKLSNLKQYFLGGESRTVSMDDANAINMTDIFNTCYEKEKAINNITKEHNNFIKTCENIIKVFDDESKKIEAEVTNSAKQGNKQGENPQSTENTPDPDLNALNTSAKRDGSELGKGNNIPSTGGTSTSGDMPSVTPPSSSTGTPGFSDPGPRPQESFIYSNLYSSYISEGIVSKVGSGSSGTDSGSMPASGNGLGNSVQTIKQGAASSQEYEKVSVNATAELTPEQATTLIKNVKEELTNYRTLTGNIFTAKMNALTTIYKNYLEIIRTHVRSYAGDEKNDADNTPVRTGTKYNAPQEQPAQNNNK